MKGLYRSLKNKKVFGVCGGIAEYFDLDVVIIRVLTLSLIVYSYKFILVYLLAAMIIPKEDHHGELL